MRRGTNRLFHGALTVRLYNAVIDKIASVMTSAGFVALFFSLVAAWIAWNTYTPYQFDPRPWMMLNLVMSALAGIQATTVAVAQRKAERLQRRRDQKITERLLHLSEAQLAILKTQEIEMDEQDQQLQNIKEMVERD